jgi:hypothetical protein
MYNQRSNTHKLKPLFLKMVDAHKNISANHLQFSQQMPIASRMTPPNKLQVIDSFIV